MKISKKPTEWVLITVSNDNPLDAADFIIVQLTNAYMHKLRLQLEAVKMIADTPDFYCLCCWDAPMGWFKHHGEGIAWHLEHQQLTCTFITWDDENEFNELLSIDQQLDAQQLCVFGSGTAQFIGTGKHSQEEYYSTEFPLAKILRRYDNR